METLYSVLIIFGAIICGYLIGSVSTSILIGRIFYKVDIRDHGSGNAGGTNAGRILGKKAGAAVIIIDILKMVIFHWALTLILRFTSLGDLVNPNFTIYIACFSLTLGHCFPIFHKFRGGKAVSGIAGFALATNWLVFLVAFIVFVTILKLKKKVSLSSITGSLTISVMSLVVMIPSLANITFYPLVYITWWYPFFLALTCAVLIILHSSNIKRIIKGTERKITWLR